jgi:nicotinate dehydrogenase subunit B
MRARCSLALAALVVLTGCRLRSSLASDDAGAAPDVDVDSPAGQGMLAVQTRQCGQCHQSPNPGDGVLSGQTTPVHGTHAYGSNLTPDPDTGMDSWDAGSIAMAILSRQGVDGGALCPAMPSYADAGMGSDEALSIAAYLQSLPPVWRPIPPSTCAP